jgi:sugar/nucleoside kinase (ribokinase family)
MTPTRETVRCGIAAGGNWIVDHVKTVDRLPGRGMLGSIRAETASTGGAPANVLADLALMGAPFPLAGWGLVGDDADGAFILERFRGLGVDVAGIRTLRGEATSYTDVMNEQGTGDRSFYHQRGANARFGPEHVPVDALSCRLFHLGYVLLLDRMDEPDPEHGTVAAGFLKSLREQGIRTSLDVVSEEGDRFAALVPPALRYVDVLILNEIEAGRTVGREVRGADERLDTAALVEAVEEIHALGDMDVVVVHMPEGAYLRERDGRRAAVGSLELPESAIRSSVGAGDAFCAGMLFGLHEGWDVVRGAELGVACAAACLSSDGASEGLRPRDEVLALREAYPAREPPIDV